MSLHSVKILVPAKNVMQAKMMAKGVQNIVDELSGNTEFLLEVADKHVAQSYGSKIKSLLNNPILKKIAGTLG